jgi:hypothetical protein
VLTREWRNNSLEGKEKQKIKEKQRGSGKFMSESESVMESALYRIYRRKDVNKFKEIFLEMQA